MREVILLLTVLSCYRYHYRTRKEKLFESYTCSKEENLIQVTIKGYPFKEFISNSLEMESRIKLITFSKGITKLSLMKLSLKNAKSIAIKKIKNIVYELKIGTTKLGDYLNSSYLKYEIDKLISSNTEIVSRKWNNKYECELTMSLDISLINSVIRDKIIKKYDDK